MSFLSELSNPTVFNEPSSESVVGNDENADPYHSHPNSPLPLRSTKLDDKMSSIQIESGAFSPMTSPKPSDSNKGIRRVALSPTLVLTPGRAEDSPGNVAIRDRFQHAVTIQQRRNKERVQMLKSEPSRKLTSSDSQDLDGGFSSPAQKSLVKQISSGNLTPNKVWTDAIQNLRSSSNRDSQSFVRKIDSFHVASTRINEWEEHSVQFPTANELAALWRKISGFARCTMEEQENFLLRSMDEDDSVLVLLLGAVKIIRLQSPSETVSKYLDKTMKHPTRYVGVGTQLMPRSNVRIVAMLSRLRAGDYAAFLLAKPMSGYEHGDFSHLGVHTLSFVTDQGPRLKVMQVNVELVDGRRKMSAKLLRSVPLVEKLNNKHYEQENYHHRHDESGELNTSADDASGFNFGDVYDEDSDMEYLLERVDSQDNDHDKAGDENEVKDESFETIAENKHTEQQRVVKEAWEVQANEEQLLAAQQRNHALKARMDAMAPSVLLGLMSRNSIRAIDDRRSPSFIPYNDEYERNDDQVQDQVQPYEDQKQLPLQNTSSSEADQEETEEVVEPARELFLEEVNSPLPNRTKQRAPQSQEKAPFGSAAAGMDYLLSLTSLQHEDLDSTSQSTSSQAFLQLDLESIDEIGCSDRLFVTSSHQRCSSTVISGNLKQVVSQKQSKFVVQDHRVFEWIKGVACSGWMNKLPASSHGWGRPVRRYFLLRDNVLTYSNDKPFEEGDQRGANKKLILGEDSILEHVTIMFMPCLRIRTVNGEELYLKLRPGSRKEELWTQALTRTIALQKTKREALSTTIKTLWLDERDVFELISVDAQNAAVGEAPGHQSNSNGYIKVALFKCREDIKAGPMFSIHSTSSIRSLSTHGFEPQLMYYLEILGGDDENAEEGDMKLKLPLVKTNESSFTTPASQPLHCVKIYGDKIIFGGSGGSIFVGTVGKATDLSLHRGGKVVYVIPCRDNLDTHAVMMSGPHKSSSRHASLGKGLFESSSSGNLIGSGVHAGASTVLFLAWEATNEIFVAVDNHRLLSFWQLDRGHGAGLNPSVANFGSSKKRPGHYYSIKPEYQSSFDLCRADPKGIYRHEIVLGAYFLPESGRLIVSTSQRLLLLIVTYDCRRRLMGMQGEVPVSSYDYYSACCFGVSAYTQLDQVDDVEIQRGLFGLQVIDPVQQLLQQQQQHHPSPLQQASQLTSKTSPYRAEEVMKERRLSHRSMSFDHQQLPQRRIIHWRFLSDTTGEGPKHLCQVTRQEWSRERYSQAVRMAIGVSATT